MKPKNMLIVGMACLALREINKAPYSQIELVPWAEIARLAEVFLVTRFPNPPAATLPPG